LQNSSNIINDFPQFGASQYILFSCINDQTYDDLLLNFPKYNDYLINLRELILNSNVKFGYVPGIITHNFHCRIEHRQLTTILGQLKDWEFVKDILTYDEQGILIPNFENHNTTTFLKHFNNHVSMRNMYEIIINKKLDIINKSNILAYINTSRYSDFEPVWGPKLWIFSHTLANHILSNQIEQKLFDILTSIFINLPCQSCSKDSVEYFSQNPFNFDSIKTSEELQLYFFNFHNFINAKFSKPIYEYNSLQSEYSRIELSSIYEHFLIIFATSDPGLTMQIKEFFDPIIKPFSAENQ